MSLIWTSGLSALVAVLVVWLTSRLASIRAHDDRTWDRKAGAYSAIFEALYDLAEFFDQHLMDYLTQRETSDEVNEERRLIYKSARQRLGQVIAREVWLLAPAVKSETDKLNRALEAQADSWFDDMDSGTGAVIAAQKAISSLAAEDLKRPKLIPFVFRR